ncbi:hypothetical protein ACIGKQ_03995 [Gordonia sp. NPDC062954]|uniref:sunset domain-containing protein n=1 Tax=Gordonia sp. NPDC062954 TaxID=3364003 RepID=UPI0037CAEC50
MMTRTRRRTQRTAGIVLGATIVASHVLFVASQAGANPIGVGASGADTNAADETEGSDWWWLLVPFLLILVGLLLIWLFTTFRQSAAPRAAATAEQPDGEPVAAAAQRLDEVGPEAAAPVESFRTKPAEQAESAADDEVTMGEPPAGLPSEVESSAADSGTADTVAAATGPAPAQSASGAVAASGSGDGPATEVSDLTMPLSLEELMAEDLSEVMAPPDDAELGFGSAQSASGDGVGSYYRDGEKTPVPLGAHLPLVDSDRAPDGYPVKASASSGTYHLPGSSTYDAVAPDIWFASESAAAAARFRRSDAD